MPYLPNIPQASQTLKSSQPQLLDNFSTLESVYGYDHFPYTESDVNLIGRHKSVTLDVSAGSPSTLSGQLALFSKDVGGSTELFLKHDGSGTEYQLTSGGSIGGVSWNLVSTHILAGQTHVDIPCVANKDYLVIIRDMTQGGTFLFDFSTDGGSTFLATKQVGVTEQRAAAIAPSYVANLTSTTTHYGELQLANPNNTANRWKTGLWDATILNTENAVNRSGSIAVDSTASNLAVDLVRLYVNPMLVGTFSGGTMKVYSRDV